MRIKFPRAEFFDIFGIATFGVITFLGVRGVFFGEPLQFWALVFLLIVGIAGLLVDGAMVYRTYVKQASEAGAEDPNMVK